jgi:hypothetical protein
MSLVLVVVLALAGIAILFVLPWIGAAVLAAALVLGAVLVFRSTLGAVSAESSPREEPPAPHLPGPGSPEA